MKFDDVLFYIIIGLVLIAAFPRGGGPTALHA